MKLDDESWVILYCFVKAFVNTANALEFAVDDVTPFRNSKGVLETEESDYIT